MTINVTQKIPDTTVSLGWNLKLKIFVLISLAGRVGGQFGGGGVGEYIWVYLVRTVASEA